MSPFDVKRTERTLAVTSKFDVRTIEKVEWTSHEDNVSLCDSVLVRRITTPLTRWSQPQCPINRICIHKSNSQ